MLHAQRLLDVVLARESGSADRPVETPKFALPLGADLVVLGDVVAVQVAPGPRVGDGGERVVALGPAAGPRQHVLADAALDSGPGVAEEVVHSRHPRREVVPVRLVLRIVPAERRA